MTPNPVCSSYFVTGGEFVKRPYRTERDAKNKLCRGDTNISQEGAEHFAIL